MLHLCGDPTDTIASLLYTLEVCQRRVERLRGRRHERRMKKENWKVLTLIMASYEESGNVDAAAELEEM